MIGLVLWFNPEAKAGMIWCEDQGPLAFLSPEVDLPDGVESLSCGDRLTFTVELRDDIRFVRDIYALTPATAGADPRDILMGYHRGESPEENGSDDAVPGHLSVVA